MKRILLITLFITVFITLSAQYVLNQPRNLTGTIGQNENGATIVNLHWQAPLSGSTGQLTGYVLYRNGTQIGLTSVMQRAYIDVNVTPGATYSYEVTAVYDRTTESDASEHVVITIQESRATTKKTGANRDGRFFLNFSLGANSSSYDTDIIPISASFDFRLGRNSPLTLGFIGTFSVWDYEYYYYYGTNDYGYYYSSIENFSAGLRFQYHWLSTEHWDIYTGVVVGFIIQSGGGDGDFDYEPLLIGGSAGVKWYFTKHFGIFSETGYDALSWNKSGFTFRW
jgi:hypothetical protein